MHVPADVGSHLLRGEVQHIRLEDVVIGKDDVEGRHEHLTQGMVLEIPVNAGHQSHHDSLMLDAG